MSSVSVRATMGAVAVGSPARRTSEVSSVAMVSESFHLLVNLTGSNYNVLRCTLSAAHLAAVGTASAAILTRPSSTAH